jgi:hypothetical protein
MIPVKIQCGCGQRYSFEVEAVDGRMPSSVACPACSTDGTDAANTFIASSFPASVAATKPAVTVRVNAVPRLTVHKPAAEEPAPATASPEYAAGRGQSARAQAEIDARAKVSWGDSEQDVIKHLMIGGYTYQEAVELAKGMFAVRAKEVRAGGMKKVFFGIVLVCVPIVAGIIFLSVGFFPLKIFGATVVVGVYGAWCILKGTVMFVAPKSEPGDVATQ